METKAVLEVIKNNKSSIIKKVLIGVGCLAGLALAAVAITKVNSTDDVNVESDLYENEVVKYESTSDSED